ncbi:MAG: proton-conducting transporter membrane subunit [Chloroflexota bacterium]|nr:proton-conducting transporter membrane subunit [Chloroflexota bacterium]
MTAWIGCGADVVDMLSMGLVTLPLLAGAWVAVTLQRAHPSTAHRVALTATGLTALCTLALLPCTGDDPAITVEWLPNAGSMGLTTGATGLYAALVTSWAAFLVSLDATSRSAERPPLSAAVTLLALAATNVAFLTDHFLARYIALEIVALCIALVLLVEVRNSAGVHLAWKSYLLLRLGDAGLLTAILILEDASGTLSIGPALEAGGALDGLRLGWVVAGLVLAVWVKLGIWPFHLWSQPGRRLTLASQAWLYATVMPNLGLYLLYRVTPLLVLAGPLQTTALWLGAGGAALATLIALTRADVRGALVYVGAAQGGLALFVAASGVKPAVWLGLLALTPLRLLLFLAADAAQSSDSVSWRRAAAGLFALGGLALAAFGLLTTWWAREAGAPLDALLVAEAAVALTGVWAASAAWRPLSDPKGLGKPLGSSEVHWTQWVVVGLLGSGVLAGGLAFGPLTHHLATASRMALPTVPTLLALLRYAATTPALLVVLALVLAVWWFQRYSGLSPLVSAQPAEKVYDLEEGLAQAAQVLHAVVEVGILEQIVALTVRAVVGGARLTYRIVEREGLEGFLRASVRVVMDGARLTYRVVEREGLEGFLRGSVRVVVDEARLTYRVVEHEELEGFPRRSVQTVLALGRGLQRWHTGRLRRNLLWVAVSLALMVLTLVLHG